MYPIHCQVYIIGYAVGGGPSGSTGHPEPGGGLDWLPLFRYRTDIGTGVDGDLTLKGEYTKSILKYTKIYRLVYKMHEIAETLALVLMAIWP